MKSKIYTSQFSDVNSEDVYHKLFSHIDSCSFIDEEYKNALYAISSMNYYDDRTVYGIFTYPSELFAKQLLKQKLEDTIHFQHLLFSAADSLKNNERQKAFEDVISDQDHLKKSNYKKFKKFRRKYSYPIFIRINNCIITSTAEFPYIPFKKKIIPIIEYNMDTVKIISIHNAEYREYRKSYLSRLNKGLFKSFCNESVISIDSKWICPCCGKINFGEAECETCGILPKLYKIKKDITN